MIIVNPKGIHNLKYRNKSTKLYMSRITLHAKALLEGNFADGERVLVTRKVKSYTSGWDNSWSSEMDAAIGKIGTIEDGNINEVGIILKFEGAELDDADGHSYPAHALVLVADDVESVIPVTGYGELKEGDTVLIARKSLSKDAGYRACGWPSEADDAIGKIATITRLDTDSSCRLKIKGFSQFDDDWFPIGCLYKIQSKPKASDKMQTSNIPATKDNIKEGDKVRIVKKYGNDWNSPDMDPTVGMEGTVWNLQHNGKGVRVDVNNTSWYYEWASIEKVVEPVKPATSTERHDAALRRLSLKDGDRVKLISSASDRERGWTNSWQRGADKWIGKEGIIDDRCIDERGVRVKFSSDEGYPVPAFCLEKVVNVTTSVATEALTHEEAFKLLALKKGDKVKVTKTAKGHIRGWNNSWTEPMNQAVGKTCTVISNSYTPNGVALDFDNYGTTTNLSFPAFVLEKVVVDLPASSVKVTADNIKNGDKVKIVKKYGSNWNSSVMDKTIGMIGIVSGMPSSIKDGIRVEVGSEDWWYDFQSLELVPTGTVVTAHVEQHSEAIARLNFKNGDSVKLLRKAADNENGWNNRWDANANNYIGLTGIINDSNINSQGAYVVFQRGSSTEGFPLPVFCLEKVAKTIPIKKEEPKVVVVSGKVDCTKPLGGFSVGDKVKVISTGPTYSNYTDMFNMMDFRNPTTSKSCSTGEIGTIFALKVHGGSCGDVLAGINLEGGKQVLIGVKGIEKYIVKATASEDVKKFAVERAKALEEIAAANIPTTFRVGDTVIVSKNTSDGHVVGTKGTITKRKDCTREIWKVESLTSGKILEHYKEDLLLVHHEESVYKDAEHTVTISKDFLPASGREVEIIKSALGYQVVVGPETKSPSVITVTTEVPNWKTQIKETFPDFKMLVLG